MPISQEKMQHVRQVLQVQEKAGGCMRWKGSMGLVRQADLDLESEAAIQVMEHCHSQSSLVHTAANTHSQGGTISKASAPWGCAGGTAPSSSCAWRGAASRTGSGCPGTG